tara:strand:- start:692 stop:847 length:156 start_codon:yes stop_codon:yes gene_type:complete
MSDYYIPTQAQILSYWEVDRSVIIDKLYYMGIGMGYSLDYMQFMNKMRGYE